MSKNIITLDEYMNEYKINEYHSYVDYSGLDSSEKRKEAIEDLKKWLGIKKYEELTSKTKKAIKDGKVVNRDGIHFAMSFAGVEGYPVLVWIEDVLDGKHLSYETREYKREFNKHMNKALN
jgi:hypothetical protein